MVLNTLKQIIPASKDRLPRAFRNILARFKNRDMNDEGIQMLWRAYQFGEKAHKGQYRRSGEPYFIHCTEVAATLAEWNCDDDTIIAGLLHDTIEDTQVTKEDIAREFNETVASLVYGVSKLSGFKYNSRQQKQADNFMRLFLNVAKDIRVIIIKFADRLHNMKTLHHLPLLKQQRIARETRDVFAPLAHRLGMGKVKSEFEDLCLSYLHPDEFKTLKKKIKSTRSEREKYINEFIHPIQEYLDKENVNAEIYGRAKHYYSIYRKMQNRGISFEDIYDLMAIRIIVNKLEDCYLALGIVHNIYKPLIERFKDYISTPKINGYQSLHTTVFGKQGRLVEIQIRTHQMDRVAEVGVAAHWMYKERGSVKVEDKDSDQIRWLRELVEVLQSEDKDPGEFLNLLKIDLFQEEIFIFSPKGDLFRLPVDSTPVDFAFAVHTQVGFHCIGAKVNAKMVPLNTKLKNSDTVEILTSPNHHPSPAWLKFVQTGKAKTIIKRWIKKEQFQRSVTLGQEILEKTLRRLKKSSIIKKIQKDPQLSGYPNLEGLYSALGSGQMTVRQLLEKYDTDNQTFTRPEDAPETITEKFLRRARGAAKGVLVDGIDNTMIKFGKCCNPIPGDQIMGFVTRGRGVTVHRSDCRNLPVTQTEDRLLGVEWHTSRNQAFIVRLKIIAEDRKYLLRDVVDKISLMDVNIVSVNVTTGEGIATGIFIIQVRDKRQLDRILNKLKSISGLIHLERT